MKGKREKIRRTPQKRKKKVKMDKKPDSKRQNLSKNKKRSGEPRALKKFGFI